MQQKIDKQTHDLSTLHLTPDTFEPIYNTIVGLRFPIDVAQVLELRYVINHAVDDFPDTPDTQDYREFRDALQSAIDSFAIDNKHHCDRLLKILTMMRDLHYTYSINSRDTENELREAIAQNRGLRVRAIRYGLVFTVLAVLSGIIWMGMTEPGWVIKIFTGGCAYLAWSYLHALPKLERTHKSVNQQLSELLRQRVRSIHWKMVIQKLALVLGYKRIDGVEVFRIDGDVDGRPHLRH